MLAMTGHTGAVSHLAFSPDGSLVASGGADGTVRLWSPPSQRDIITANGGGITALFFSEAGDRIAFGTETDGIQIASLPTLAVEKISGLLLPVTGSAFMQDGTLAISLGDPLQKTYHAKPFGLIDLTTLVARPFSAGTRDGIRAIAASPAHRLVAWATDVRLIEVRELTVSTPRFRASLKTEIRRLALSGDGKRLAAATDWKVHVFDLTKREEQFVLSGHKGVVSSVAFTADGRRLFSASWDRTIKMWNAESGANEATFDWGIGRVTSLAVARDGLRAAAGSDSGTIILWDLED